MDNSIGKTHELFGDLYVNCKDEERAKAHYELAINSFETMLKRAPKLQEVIERIEGINQEIS